MSCTEPEQSAPTEYASTEYAPTRPAILDLCEGGKAGSVPLKEGAPSDMDRHPFVLDELMAVKAREEEQEDEKDRQNSVKVNRSSLTVGKILSGHGIFAACANIAVLVLGFLAKAAEDEIDFHSCPYARHGAIIKAGACCLGLITIVAAAYIGATANGICAEATSNAEELKTDVSIELLVAIHGAQGELARLRWMTQVTWLATSLLVLVTVVGCGFDGAAAISC
eukprot:m.114401 g.114401  ORF g.114401 m.114401 type:complete len:224 (-) comp13051_c0_seq2:355-1026(-)